ncbi:MAG: ATP synthase F1 subunit delta [Magnetococcales bacterium]|nr:ATP synthase F1 subunit delta [Magnetococcales bacterium]
MHESTVAKRYALALADLAAQEGRLDEVGASLTAFQEAMTGVPGLRLLLTSPAASPQAQEQALGGWLEQTAPGALASNFFRLLLAKRRMGIVDFILAAYRREQDRRENRVTVQVKSAREMTPEMTERLAGTLQEVTGKSVTLQSEIDPGLLGGLVVRLGSVMMDYSVRNRVNRLKATMKG